MGALGLTGPQPYVSGAAGGSLLVGYVNANNSRVFRYAFTTPATGVSKFTLSGSLKKYEGSDIHLRFKVTTSATGYEKANANSSYDGTITSNEFSTTVSLTLKPSTVYYLWLFPGQNVYGLWQVNWLSASVEPLSYALDISEVTGVSITVDRTSSLANAATGNLPDGAILYHGDVIKVTAIADAGYEVLTFTMNGSDFASGDSITVTADVAVAVTARLLGIAYIERNGVPEKHLICIDTGTELAKYAAYVEDGTNWSAYP